MKKCFIALLLAAMLLSPALRAPAEEDADDRRLVVEGAATVMLPADMARLELGSMVKAATVEEAQTESDRIIRAVLDVLKEMGIDEKDIVTSTYGVYTETPYEEYGSIRKADPVYNVNNMLNIRVRDLNHVGRIIDVASKAGANQIYGLTFASSKEGEAYQQALERAVENARQNAEVLAKAAGKTLGALVRIENRPSDIGYYEAKGSSPLEFSAAADTPIVSGEIGVSASVTLSYIID